MIMVEALVQQLAVARAHGSPAVGSLPSELRDKLVQTDHTELSQVIQSLLGSYDDSSCRMSCNHVCFSADHNVQGPVYGSTEQDR